MNNSEYKSNDSQPQFEAFAIFKHVSRIARGTYCIYMGIFTLLMYCLAVVEVAIAKKWGSQLKHGLELCVLQ